MLTAELAPPPWRDDVHSHTDGIPAIDSDLVKALTAAGFAAIQRNAVAEAGKIFGFLKQVRPNSDFVAIGLALTALTDRRVEAAQKILADARSHMPDDENLKKFHALALALGGQLAEAQALQRSLTASTCESAVQFGRALSVEIAARSSPMQPGWQRCEA